MIINESGMRFGEYTEETVFQIEKSHIYKKIQQNIPIAEFILLQFSHNKPIIYIIEAKSSSPRQTEHYISDIQTKFINSLTLWFALRLERHPDNISELSAAFQKLEIKTLDIRFILVIKKAKKDWLPPLQDMLNKALRPTLKLWGISSQAVVVLNEEMARQYKLCL